MKNLSLLLLVFLFVSCATYSELPDDARHYDYWGYYYNYPNMYFEPYPFWTGRDRYRYYWSYTPRYDSPVYTSKRSPEHPKFIKDYDKYKDKEKDKGKEKPNNNHNNSYNNHNNSYTPTYRTPTHNTTPRFNNTSPSTTTPSTRQPAGGSRSNGGRNNP